MWEMSWRDSVSARRVRPPVPRGALPRPRLLELLRAGRVSVLEAPAGYGKTTLLAAHVAELGPVAWLTVTRDDTDAPTLAAHLAASVAHLSAVPLKALEGGAAIARVVDAITDVLVNADALLVLDDAQHLSGLGLLQPLLSEARVTLVSRTVLTHPELTAAAARGELARVAAADLSFNTHELAALMSAAGVHASEPEVRLALAVTEGWPIAARFLTQALAGGRVSWVGLRHLERQSTQLADLLEYLAQEVLGPLDPTLRAFLTRASVFDELTAELLQGVLGETRSATYLDALARGGTFLTHAGGAYRTHPLLQAHLRALLPDAERRELARRGAAYFETQGQHRAALNAHLLAGDADRAAALLEQHGQRWLEQGRVHLLQRALEELPISCWTARPALHALMGDAYRAQSRYAEALAAYTRAPEELGRLGMIRVYLDTVQPALAAPLLRPEDDAALRAENALNAGDLTVAAQADPRVLRSPRYALRSGDPLGARAAAREAARGERGGQRTARNHREALLLESLLAALVGDVQEAEDAALAGLEEGGRLESPFVESLAFTRLGHARLARGEWAEARESYDAALTRAAGLAAPRLRAEPLMGIAFLDAVAGGPADAAREALDIVRTSGDRWMEGLVRLTFALGRAHVRHEQAEAELRGARAAFAHVGDRFGRACADLALFALGPAAERSAAAVEAVRAFPFLLVRPALFAPARSRAGRAHVLSLLGSFAPAEPALLDVARALGYEGIPEHHPGVALRVQVLDRVALYRNGQEVREWGRAKARDLLALLAFHPDGVEREAAQEALFPEGDPVASDRNFRTVLHALGQLLGESVLERGERLRFRWGPDVTCDLHEARAALAAAAGTEGRAGTLLGLPARVAPLEFGVAELEADLYASRLPEALTEEAERALASGRAELAARLASRALQVDAAFEPAACVLMRAQHARGQRSAVARAYRHVEDALAALGLTPLPETTALFERLARGVTGA